MKDDAKRHADEDKQLKDKVEKLNQADALIFSTRKQLDEHKDKLSDGNKDNINAALTKLEELHKAESVDEIDGAIEELNKAWAEASSELYSQASQEEGAEGQPAAGSAP